jgi:cobalamin biosynthesis protein CobT
MTTKKRAKAQPKTNAAAQNATRAADIFGVQSSLFTGRAKVSTLGLQRGVSEMVRRVYATVPGVAPMHATKPQIKVTYIGESACAKYEWGRDAAGRLSVAGVINLPACGDASALIPRAVADQYTGYSLHEMAHFLYTPLNAFGGAIQQAARDHNVSQAFAKSIINGLEDVAIERDLIRSGYAPGAGAMLRGLLEKCIADVPRSAYGTIKAFPVTLCFGLRGYTAAALPLVNALPPALRAIYDDAKRGMAALPQRQIGDAGCMGDLLAVADKVLAALAALRDAQPQPPDQPDEPGDGEPGDAGNEPGDGEPGDAGNEPGDGEPQPGGEGGEDEGDEDGEPGDGDDTDSMGEHGDKAPPRDALPPNPDLPDDVTPDADDAGEAGDNTPSKADGSDTPPLDTSSLKGTPLDADMQPEAAGDAGDGASGLANDAVRVVRAAEPGAVESDSVAADVAKALTKSARVAHGLRTLLDTSARDSREGGRKNGRLDMGSLSRIATGAANVFEKRAFRDGTDAAVSILIDQSSSMNSDDRYVAARALAGTLSKIVSGCAGVRCEILGFHSGGGSGARGGLLEQMVQDEGTEDDRAMWRSMRGDCCITIFKAFNEAHARGMARLGSCIGTGGTPDAAAITHAAQRLAKESAEQKILIVIADGEGSPPDVLARIVSRIERDGTTLIGIGIDQDMSESFTHRARVNDISKLNESGLSTLLRVLGRSETAQAIKAGGD